MMARRSIMIACLVLHGSFTSAGEEKASSLTDRLARGEEPVRIVCFGDSITGVYYHTGGWRAYPEMLEIALKMAYPKARVQVINAGISGHNTRNALARIDRDVLKHKPHLVTIMFGMNDLVAMPLAEFKANLEKLIDQCQKAGAEVMLCTQNAVLENTGRPNTKLDAFTQVIKAMAKERKLALADCNRAYLDVRAKDAQEFRLLMSDAIHPNMDGHKLLAQVIARTISGKDISLANVAPPSPAIKRTLSLLKAGKPVKVLAMPPYDKLIDEALKKLDPKAVVEVTMWPTAGQSLAAIERFSLQVRKMSPDLVVIAVPADAKAKSTEELINSFTWVMNWSLSFAYQQWDCIVIPPSATNSKLTDAERERDQLFRRLIIAQHIGMVTRQPGDDRPAATILAEWLADQAKTK